MASTKSSESEKHDPATMLQWFTGRVLCFKDGIRGEYFVHENLLKAKCATTNFCFEFGNKEHRYEHLSASNFGGFTHFLLWLNCGTMAPLGDDPEESYLAAFRFASVYGLHEFKDFISSKFGEFAPLYYGGDGEGNGIHNPGYRNLAWAHDYARNENIRDFIIEQFVRSWVYRHAYSDMELDWLVDKHPKIAKILFQKVQDVVRQSRKKSLATFEWRATDTPMDDNDDDGNQATDGDRDNDQPVEPEEANHSDEGDHESGDSQESSDFDDQHTSSTDGFEVVAEEAPGEVLSPEPEYAEEVVECDVPAAEKEAPPPDEYEPAKETELVQEGIHWGWGARPAKENAKSVWGMDMTEPTVAEVPEVVGYAVEALPELEPVMDAVAEPAVAVPEETVGSPKKSKKKRKGLGKKAKAAKAARAAVESGV